MQQFVCEILRKISFKDMLQDPAKREMLVRKIEYHYAERITKALAASIASQDMSRYNVLNLVSEIRNKSQDD